MNKIFTLFAVLLLCFSVNVFADGSEDFTVQQVSQCSNFVGSVESITDSNTTVALFTAPYTTKALQVINTGANEIWVDVDDATATAGTDDETRIDPGQSRAWNGFKTSNIGIICSSGETSEAVVEACR